MSKVLVSESSLTSTASAIRATLNSNDTMLPSQFFDNIEEMVRVDLDPDVTPVFKIPKGNVNFYDYNGELLYSYSSREFIKKGVLPDNPHHEGLIAQGWNWEYEEILKQAIQVGGDINVGQMYITQSGATQIDIELDQDSLEPYLYFEAIPSDNNIISLIVDWGDNSIGDNGSFAIYSNDGQSTIINEKHIYSQPGNYTIKITVNQGEISFTGTSNFSKILWNNNNNNNTYMANINSIRIGSNIKLNNYAFINCCFLKDITISNLINNNSTLNFTKCYFLKSIVIPNNITKFDFIDCYSLTTIALPYNITMIFDYWLQNCYDLKSVTLPKTLNYIGTEHYKNCFSLKQIIIPNSVSSLYPNSFEDCYNVLEYHFQSITPPILSTNVFTGINQNCKIYVPYSEDHSILNAYKTATNWSTWADYIVEEEANEFDATAEYAVFDSQDGSLTFFRGEPNSFTNGQVIGTKTYYIGIKNTGQSSTPPWYGKRNNIQKVIFKDQIYPNNCYRWFQGCINLTQFINLDKLNTLWVYNMTSMFKGCSSLIQLDLSNFNTSGTHIMKQMFSGCSSLEKINLTSFNTSWTYDMSYMFNNCSSLIQLDLSNFNTRIVEDISYMFYGCSSLTQLDLSNFNVDKVNSIQSMFEGCSSLKQLNLSNFQLNYFSNQSFSLEYMFRNCSALQSLDLSSFRITKYCPSTYGMFENCFSLKYLDLSSFIFSEDTETTSMFSGCSKLSTNLTFSEMPTIYSNMFLDAATQSNALITLKYVSPVTSNDIDDLIATGSSNSNIINGGEGISINPEKIVGIIPNTNTIIQVPSEILNFTTTPEYSQYLSSTPITYEYDDQERSYYPLLAKSYCSFNLENLNIKPIFSLPHDGPSNNLYSIHLQYKGNLSLNILDQSDNIIWTGNSDVVKNSFNDTSFSFSYQQFINMSPSEQLVDFNIITNKFNNQTKIFLITEGNNIYFYDNNNNEVRVLLMLFFSLNQDYINCNLVCVEISDSDNFLNDVISYDQETYKPLFKLQFTFNNFEAKIIYEDRRKVSCPMKLVDNNSTIQAVLPTDATGTVEFSVGDIKETVQVINGIATPTFSEVSLGRHHIKGLYLGDDKYSYAYDDIFATITIPQTFEDRPLLTVDTLEADDKEMFSYTLKMNIKEELNNV